jgi:ribonuclease VapC
MTVFIDASALVAILAMEPDSETLRLKLKATKKRLISPIAMFEASLAMRRLRDMSPTEALGLVGQFIKIYAMKQISIDPRTGDIATEAFELFGKGRHKAALNMGDCFAYACARQHKVPLLCKGDDFIHTDIEMA